MRKVNTPGCTETFKIKELIEMAEKYPKETIISIMSDFHWLIGYAEGLKEGYE